MTDTEQLAQAAVIVHLSLGDYAPIRFAYQLGIAGTIQEYLNTPKARVTKFRNIFKKAIAVAFDEAYTQGYVDGGSRREASADDNSWLAAKIDSEFGFVDWLFLQLKDFKSNPEISPDDYQAEAERRANGYAKTLDGVYNEGRLRGAKDKMLTFGGDDGEESCTECQRYKGQRHKASWWVMRGLLPGQPGNRNYSCGGYNCQHFLFDDNGNLFTF